MAGSNELIDLTLNEGPWVPAACRWLLESPEAVGLAARYGDPEATELVAAIAAQAQVGADQVLLGHGSGPLLAEVASHLVRHAVTRSPIRLARHALRRSGFPLITTEFTYGKVVASAVRRGHQIRLVPMKPAGGRFRLDTPALEELLIQRPGLVYLCNPNNPTGQAISTATELGALAGRHRSSVFWIDEAYAGYLEGGADAASLVVDHDNVVVSRSLSFAHGLAGIRLGWLFASAPLVANFRDRQTPWQFGALQHALALAAVTDTKHLAKLRQVLATNRAELEMTLARHDGVEAYPSITDFVLCRFTDGRTGAALAQELLTHAGLRIKVLDPAPGFDHSAYFRLSAHPDHLDRLCSALDTVLPALRPSSSAPGMTVQASSAADKEPRS